MKYPSFILLLIGLSPFLCFITGCSKPLMPTEGVVRFSDGSPVRSGSIEFRRLTDKERFASRISPIGEFVPVDSNGRIGLPIGTYEVVVVQIVMTEDLAMEAHEHGTTVPRRFADYYTSGLKMIVAKGDSNPLELVIPESDS